MTLALPATVIDCSVLEHSEAGEVDALTLERCRQGDRAALECFVRTYESKVFAFLSRMMGRGPHVEDMAQEVFIRAYKALPRFEKRPQARVSTWLLTIAARLVKDARKKRRLQVVPLEAVRVPHCRQALGPERAHASREIAAALQFAASQLSEEQRLAFVLAEFHGLSMAEIATVTSTTTNTAKTRLSRARSRLRELMQDTWETYRR